MVSEEERQLKDLRRMMSAVLANSAYSYKEEHRQLQRVQSMTKLDDELVGAGVLTAQEAKEHAQEIDRELGLLRRAYAARRHLVKKVMGELEGALDEVESS